LDVPKKQSQQFQFFFYNDQNTGCYNIRNDLLHGNPGLDHKEISKKIPDLNDYLRTALLKVLDSYVNGTLKLTDAKYFEELDKFIGLLK
jgi:hypothetical protein